MSNYLIGSISHGTLRNADLIPCFAETLKSLDKNNKYSELLQDAMKWEDMDQDEQSDLFVELFDALNDFAAPFFYFGAHEGNGSDFGFWFSRDSFEEDVRFGAISTGDSLLDAALKADNSTVEYLAVISDHGNTALFDLEGNEIWSIV